MKSQTSAAQRGSRELNITTATHARLNIAYQDSRLS